jgi:LysR family transcriptional regulator for bpeEF and oprC
MRYATCASAAYLERFGRPLHPNDLTQHRCVNYFSARTGKMFDWYFTREDERVQVALSSHLALSDSYAYTAAGLSGLGIVQMADFLMAPWVKDGRLVPVLDDWVNEPLPVYAVYPENRHLSAKVRVFVEWITELFSNVSTLR